MRNVLSFLRLQFVLYRAKWLAFGFYGAALPIAILMVANQFSADGGSSARQYDGLLIFASTLIVYRQLSHTIAVDQLLGILPLLRCTQLQKHQYLLARFLEALLLSLLPLLTVAIVVAIRGDAFHIQALDFIGYLLWIIILWSSATCLIGLIRPPSSFQLTNLVTLAVPTLFPLFYPPERVPAAIQPLIQWLPPSLAMEALQGVGRGASELPLVGLGLWCLVLIPVALVSAPWAE